MTLISLPTTSTLGRRGIYYWKCDRPAAFHGTQRERDSSLIEPELRRLLGEEYPEAVIDLRHGRGQGNHLTWEATIDHQRCFIRVENGPERDQHLEVESHVMDCVRQRGVPTPKVHRVDVSRERVPFAWQMMDLIPFHDLNEEYKQGRLNPLNVAYEIGTAIARWQSVPVTGFGHFDPHEIRYHKHLKGYHESYRDYFFLNWRRHLDYLAQKQFLSAAEVLAITNAVDSHEDLLLLTSGCLVHKDLAFWNILGTQEGIVAYIDWDDSVSADEMDDLSLLGCFHDGPVISNAILGYQSIQRLPQEYGRRFWLHLLRNMIVKAVIRVGAGYFDRTDSFFLFGSGMTGADLVQQTRARIFRVLDGLISDAEIGTL